jgi:hypothetical protein
MPEIPLLPFPELRHCEVIEHLLYLSTQNRLFSNLKEFILHIPFQPEEGKRTEEKLAGDGKSSV